MSPEPNQVKIYETNFTDFQDCNSDITSATKGESVEESTINDYNSEEPKETNAPNTAGFDGNDALLKPPVAKRERRYLSPCLNDGFPDPMSPSSSSSTSQATSANDTTFEPTVEMMVNDFDDEQTLNEEEALAALESQDPEEEISTLKEESEMPIEDLLAKYQALPPMPFIDPPRKKTKKSSSKKKHKSKQKVAATILTDESGTDLVTTIHDSTLVDKSTDVSNAKSGTMFMESTDEKLLPDDEDEELIEIQISVPMQDKKENNDVSDQTIPGNEKLKMRRTHLLDLYPEGTFNNVAAKDVIVGNGKDIPLETLYGVEDEEDEEVEDEDDDDYKKKVMVGYTYQATIPQGLSQYGDILPYENEDKLIWEPSQVSEREVEEYLVKIRDIKVNQTGEEDVSEPIDNICSLNKSNTHGEKIQDNMENNSLLANGEKTNAILGYGIPNTGSAEYDTQPAVVKDNEQALHLLVQCGYDFKEALRRKRLNALPLNDCMSLWSEEECQKFEEGIQKYGKDFLKIRQNQVRTRTMRELVQFYYLWKKSERRDHNFANADTVDHMDMYLNEDNDYGSNPASVTTPTGSPVGNCTSAGVTRRSSSNSQKNVSIMSNTATSNLACAVSVGTEKSATMPQQQQKRRYSNSSSFLGNIDAGNNDCSISGVANQAAPSTAISSIK